ncbi:delta-lactam-biosynthetic de-N-acetylase [Anaeropeptidivorans aminofermentans]|jgi:peptidoglycan-N-acetylmuramic acid deacetylase|uniref:delta-lactam-biosynthetic de-N-acetylase n=1 Tax=Anaeropeptidivorans aminofermentans TaxID=2934315 RepID=UPI002024516D|nr:delta-lactam-biosynthetic de-N-acetylase [Anaeropeptidivorans aminofermentans]MBE6012344.1 delta-lactam-biosynthetic de-N-acetylase [Lachnospiraceae bacterium]
MKLIGYKPIMIICAAAILFAGCEEAAEKPVSDNSETVFLQEPKASEQAEIKKVLEAPVTPSPEPTPEPSSELPEKAEEEPAEEVPSEMPSETPSEAPVMPDIASAEIQKIIVEAPQDVSYPELNFGSPYLPDGSLSNDKKGWYFGRNTTHTPPTAQGDFDIRQFDGYYLGDVSQKVVYLTFDEGYENGYTEKILDVLKEKGVTAAFFVTKPYIIANPDLIQRMVDEGHIVGNHSVRHKSCPDLTDEELMAELNNTAAAFKELTGVDMPNYFRPPMGEYSARTLKITQDLGYKSIFWSFAYKDWETDKQPGIRAAYETVMNDLHNGSIILLHAVSQSNTEAMPFIIDSIRESGYTFKSLDELPEYEKQND